MLLTTPDALVNLAKPWAQLYSHSKTVATLVTFVHVAAVVVGGGLALSLDRATLRSRTSDDDTRTRHLADLGDAHRVVLSALALSLLSGVALVAADLDTFLGSWVFWLKMALLALLLANGAMMRRAERAIGTPESDVEELWRRLRTAAIASVTLWLVVVLAGVALTNIA
ncbi:MAG TPA: hypothetical protein VGG78_08585 [Gemmatimonadaceae bacterium]